MNKELVEKYNKKTESILSDCYYLPIIITFLNVIATFLIAIFATKLVAVKLFILMGGIIYSTIMYYAMFMPLCNLFQNYKNNK